VGFGFLCFIPDAFYSAKKLGNCHIAFDFSCLIELSQLWHPVWLDRIRSTVFGGLLFGFGFRYIDLFCYAAGCVLGLFIFSLIPEG
jgi:hypothetical protein